MSLVSYQDLVAQLTAGGQVNAITLPETWLQGRTAYGGISTALLFEAVRLHNPDAPPLRSLQVTFIGPLYGELRFSQTVLRESKNTLLVEGQIENELGIGLKALFIFGHDRVFSDQFVTAPRDLPAPEDSFPIPRSGPNSGMPNFLQNFEVMFAQGTPPFSDDKTAAPKFSLWMRHHDTASHEGMGPLLAIADGPPPAIMTRLGGRTPLSSMNWHLNFYDAAPQTKAGWWLIECEASFSQNGYTAQFMRMYNHAGEAIGDATQHIVVFEPKS